MLHAFVTPDPIHAAIARHRAAFDAFQIAPEGIASIEANDEYEAASEALTSAGCTTRFGALALLEHLHWWLETEAEFAAGHQPAYGIAEARVADLALFLGTALPPIAIGRALPMGRLPSSHDAPDRRQAARIATVAGEAITAIAIIVGGGWLTALASLH